VVNENTQFSLETRICIMTGRQPVVGDLSICFPRDRAHAAQCSCTGVMNWRSETWLRFCQQYFRLSIRQFLRSIRMLPQTSKYQNTTATSYIRILCGIESYVNSTLGVGSKLQHHAVRMQGVTRNQVEASGDLGCTHIISNICYECVYFCPSIGLDDV
jgi:hypothetical protein